ncbi:MAG TPA: hypothetical protein VFE93_04180, partial [Myxococcaceae bacterium]|nr:hypothetical protein [Myxococcaceae bacterium]
HEADWDSTEVAARGDEYCEVALVCLLCGENAFADLGPEPFRWSDGSPVDDGSEGNDSAENPPPPDDAA